MVHCAWFQRIEISGSVRQCQQRHLRLSRPQQAPPRPRHTSAWRPSRPFTSMVTPKTRPEKRKHAIVVLHLAGLIFFECHLLADIVAKVENRTTLEISLKLIFGLLSYCFAFQRRYGGP